MTSRSGHATVAGEPKTTPGSAGRPASGSPFQPPARPRHYLRMLVILAGLVCIGAATVYEFRASETGSALPTAAARSGEFLAIVRCRGELRARRSAQIVAPVNVPELRIVWLAPAGEPIAAGAAAVRFDPSSARQQLAEKQAALDQAQATLDHGEAQARITAAHLARSAQSSTSPLGSTARKLNSTTTGS